MYLSLQRESRLEFKHHQRFRAAGLEDSENDGHPSCCREWYVLCPSYFYIQYICLWIHINIVYEKAKITISLERHVSACKFLFTKFPLTSYVFALFLLKYLIHALLLIIIQRSTSYNPVFTVVGPTALHTKCAHLHSWSEHLVRIADDCIPKAVFYGELTQFNKKI